MGNQLIGTIQISHTRLKTVFRTVAQIATTMRTRNFSIIGVDWIAMVADSKIPIGDENRLNQAPANTRRIGYHLHWQRLRLRSLFHSQVA